MKYKKNPDIDLSRKTGMFFSIGLAVSLLLITVAFEWKTYDDLSYTDLGVAEVDIEEIMEIPMTVQPPPPPPVLQQPEIIEVPEEEIEEEIEVNLDVEITEETKVVETVTIDLPIGTGEVQEEEVDQVFRIVEEKPEPKGGMSAFYGYIQKNLRYPEQARRMGVEGTVYVEFVVDKDGKITDVKVVKGIGAGCDEEALRVMRAAPAWNPGKQRGRPVKVRMNVPIRFRLG